MPARRAGGISSFPWDPTCYQTFKWNVVAQLPAEGWILRAHEIREWFARWPRSRTRAARVGRLPKAWPTGWLSQVGPIGDHGPARLVARQISVPGRELTLWSNGIAGHTSCGPWVIARPRGG